jgi:hypothetical protein
LWRGDFAPRGLIVSAGIADIARDRKGKTYEEGTEMRRTAKVERSEY